LPRRFRGMRARARRSRDRIRRHLGQPGDHVIRSTPPECRQCTKLSSRRTIYCRRSRHHAGQGPDAGRHLERQLQAQDHLPLQGVDVFEVFTVLPDTRWQKIFGGGGGGGGDDAPSTKLLYRNCASTPGVGAVSTPQGSRPEPMSSYSRVLRHRLNVIQGAKWSAPTDHRRRHNGLEGNSRAQKIRHEPISSTRPNQRRHRPALVTLTDGGRRLTPSLHRQHHVMRPGLEAVTGLGRIRGDRRGESGKEIATGVPAVTAASGKERRSAWRARAH